MRLSRRTTYSLLSALVFANLLLRYPAVDHEMGVDSFVWHGMATSLQLNGHALWILSPLSYLGLYPLSHPSGSPFLTVAASELSGQTIEASILLLDAAVAVLAVFVAFLLGWEFMRNEVFALLLAAVLSLTPELLTALAWQMPTRIMFTALLPLFLWGLIRLSREPFRRHALLTAATFLLMMSFHRLTVLVALVAIAYVGTGILLTVLRMLRAARPSLFLRRSFVSRSPYLAVFVLALIAASTLFLTDVLEQYSVGAVASGDSLEIQLLNLGVSLARGSGPLLPLSLLGVVAVAFQRNKTIKEPFVLVCYLVFVPMLFLRQYTSYYTVPFTALFIAFGLFAILRRSLRPRLRFAVAGAAVGFLVASSAAIAGYDLRLTPAMPHETYCAALYVRDLASGTVITNEGLIGSRLHAISGVPYLPVGGATTAFQSPELLMFRFLNVTLIRGEIVQVPPQQLTVDSDSLFVLPTVQAEADWDAMMRSTVDAMPARYSIYSVRYLFESKVLTGRYTAYGNVYPSALSASAHATRYLAYDDEAGRMFFLGR